MFQSTSQSQGWLGHCTVVYSRSIPSSTKPKSNSEGAGIGCFVLNAYFYWIVPAYVTKSMVIGSLYHQRLWSRPTTTPNCQSATPNGWAAAPNSWAATPNHQTATPNHQMATPNRQTGTPNHQMATPNRQTGTPNPQTGTPNSWAVPLAKQSKGVTSNKLSCLVLSD